MNTIQLLDKKFALSISEEEILAAIDGVAQKMNADLKDENPLFVAILNGSFMFAADLMKRLDFPCQISFVKLASYHGTTSSNNVLELVGLNENLAGRTVVIVEDIVDSGLTMTKVIDLLKSRGAGKILISTLLFKPSALKHDVELHYVAKEIPNDFIVGYGLDYDGYGRNLKEIYTLCESGVER
ncbi:MAG: hypoxanthine phosphoribosyltransferase [Prevotellaceae bacterium]|jgi:hypoxanthine phosphoribosyltransferase|nr:hypoxanthine phosphoribosyltransferase [Prevotellaceae bacterium]